MHHARSTINSKPVYRLDDRAKRTVDAVELAVGLGEGKKLTDRDRKVLRGYAGNGPLGDLFDDGSGNYTGPAFEVQGERLRALVGQETYDDLRSTVLTSYYTPDALVRVMSNLLKGAGLPKNARILEPGCGSGRFLNAGDIWWQMTGIECDPVAAKIAQLSEPEAQVVQANFQDFPIEEGTFEGVIGNVPFGEVRYSHNGIKMPVADYFVAKSVQALIPGGVAVLLVTRNFLDKAWNDARVSIGAKARLVAAARLPDNVFGEDGASVVTDILVIQKNHPATVQRGRSWIDAEEIVPPNSETSHFLNEYFVQRPSDILGKLVTRSGPFGPSLSVIASGDTLADLEQWARGVNIEVPKGLFVPDGVRELADIPEGTLTVSPRRGQLKIASSGYLVPLVYRGKALFKNAKAKTGPRTAALIELAEQRQRIVDSQLSEASVKEREKERAKGRVLWKAFVAEYGPINLVKFSTTQAGEERMRSVNLTAPFSNDPRCAAVASMEVYDEITGAAYPAPILERDVTSPWKEPKTAESAKAGLVISMSFRGAVHMGYIAGMIGKSVPETVKELGDFVFFCPQVRDWIIADEYLSGDVVAKHEAAQTAAKLDADFVRNVEALAEVLPEPLLAEEIEMKLGSPVLLQDEIEGFAKDLFSVSEGVSVAKIGSDVWQVSADGSARSSVTAKADFGTNRLNGFDILESALNQRRVTVTDEVDDGKGGTKRVTNDKETLIAREKTELVHSRFKMWWMADEKRCAALVKRYNRQFNVLRGRDYDGSHLKFPGLDLGMMLRPHQVNAVWRALSSKNNTLMAHATGSGKTSVMAAIAVKSRQMGLARRPVICVPNHLVLQVAAEVNKFFPAAKVLAADKSNFTKKGRQSFLAKVQQSDVDAIIMGHSSFFNIPVSPELESELIQDELDDLREALLSLQAEEGRSVTRRAKRHIESQIKKREAHIKSIMKSSDDGFVWEELGVDQLIFDEAHVCKNLGFGTKMTGVSGINPIGSQRASNMLYKCRAVEKVSRLSSPIVMATATPIANSLAEIRTFLAFLAPQLLKQMGIMHFDAFASVFFKVSQSLEITPSGAGMKSVARLKSFSNLPEMLALWQTVADVVLESDLDIPVPRLLGGESEMLICDLNEDGLKIQQSIISRMERIKEGGVDPKMDNALKATTDGRLLGVDPRCVEQGYGPGEKLAMVADDVALNYRQSAHIKGVQLLFMNSGVHRSPRTGFCAYDELIDLLVERGVDRSDIVTFRDEVNSPAKERKVHSDLRKGTKRIAIASDHRAGVGVDIAHKLYCQFNVDYPYRPCDLVQRRGRIVRQSSHIVDDIQAANAEIISRRGVECLSGLDPKEMTQPIVLSGGDIILPEGVRLKNAISRGSFDARLLELIAAKEAAISKVMKGDISARSIDDIGDLSLSYAEMKAAATGRPEMMVEADLSAQLQRLKTLKGMHAGMKRRMMGERGFALDYIKNKERVCELLEQDLLKKKAGESKEDLLDGNPFSGVEGNRDFLAVALAQTLSKNTSVFAQVGGFDCFVEKIGMFDDWYLRLDAASQFQFPIGKKSGGALLNMVRDRIERIESDIAFNKRQIAQEQARIKDIDLKLQEVFLDDDLLQEVADLHSRLTAELLKDEKARNDQEIDLIIERQRSLTKRVQTSEAVAGKSFDKAKSVAAQIMADANEIAVAVTPQIIPDGEKIEAEGSSNGVGGAYEQVSATKIQKPKRKSSKEKPAVDTRQGSFFDELFA